ncbi:hypothetical protein BXZ70DRAFT_922048 [Cristinia sonorae]|uniref:Uncharacterized protein n=1 Tax=Cristinia sonorae TaxID=1940300 RepID=A0A8K0XSW7_9AGAR|nr:hypothetical protein BXZ70DRAFT_922048 [Cristinia sonorae]
MTAQTALTSSITTASPFASATLSTDHLPEPLLSMPSPPSSPTPSSSSDISIDSSASLSDLSSDMLPPLDFASAQRDADNGILYISDTYPTDSLAYVPDQFKNEPVHVLSGDRIELVEELPGYAMRIKVLRTGKVGLMPSWNVEDPFERLARLNMEYNEATTCPAEQAAKSGEPHQQSECTLVHVHSRCLNQSAMTRRQVVTNLRKLRQDDASSSSGSEESLPTTLDQEPRMQTFKKRKSVKFNGGEPKVVFRYYLPAGFNKKDKPKRSRYDSDHESSESEDAPPQEEDDETWWVPPWEENPDELKAAAMTLMFDRELEALQAMSSPPIPVATPPPPVPTPTPTPTPMIAAILPVAKSETPAAAVVGKADDGSGSRRRSQRGFRGKLRMNKFRDGFKVMFQ